VCGQLGAGGVSTDSPRRTRAQRSRRRRRSDAKRRHELNEKSAPLKNKIKINYISSQILYFFDVLGIFTSTNSRNGYSCPPQAVKLVNELASPIAAIRSSAASD